MIKVLTVLKYEPDRLEVAEGLVDCAGILV